MCNYYCNYYLLDASTTEGSCDEAEAPLPLPDKFFNGFPTEITHDGHNSNGFSLDQRKCQLPDERALWSSTNTTEVDEAFTRRVLGFSSVAEMYRWVSCVDLLNQIDDLPMLLVNSLDDPCILQDSYSIAKNFAGEFIE